MIICLFRGHSWSQWYNWVRGDKQYRYCSRCGATEERIGLVVVKKRNIVNWLISLTKPSFGDPMEQSYREGLRDWYYHIPRDVLNDGIKCLANEMKKKSFDFSRFNSFSFFLDCHSCQNYRFCEDITHSMEKVFKKYERKEKVQKRGGKMRVAAGS